MCTFSPPRNFHVSFINIFFFFMILQAIRAISPTIMIFSLSAFCLSVGLSLACSPRELPGRRLLGLHLGHEVESYIWMILILFWCYSIYRQWRRESFKESCFDERKDKKVATVRRPAFRVLVTLRRSVQWSPNFVLFLSFQLERRPVFDASFWSLSTTGERRKWYFFSGPVRRSTWNKTKKFQNLWTRSKNDCDHDVDAADCPSRHLLSW
jgi:hypothetical protein